MLSFCYSHIFVFSPSALSVLRLRGGGKDYSKCGKCGNWKKKDGKRCEGLTVESEEGLLCVPSVSSGMGGKPPRKLTQLAAKRKREEKPREQKEDVADEKKEWAEKNVQFTNFLHEGYVGNEKWFMWKGIYLLHWIKHKDTPKVVAFRRKQIQPEMRRLLFAQVRGETKQKLDERRRRNDEKWEKEKKSGSFQRYYRRLYKIRGLTKEEREWQERCWKLPQHGGYVPRMLEEEGLEWDEASFDFRKKQ